MGSDELYIIEKCGKEPPFTLPSDYFETLPQRLSANLPCEDHSVAAVSPWHRHRAAIAAAACVCFMVLGAAEFFLSKESKRSVVASHSQAHEYVNESSMECVADYTMLDNEDIYALVSNN